MTYDQEFYDDAATAESARWLLPYLIERYKPKSAIDVGCGNGIWLKELQRLGVISLLGVDGTHSKYDGFIIHADLNAQFPAIRGKVDICLCLETAEHLDQSRSEGLVDFLASLSDIIIFSAAIPGQAGHGHVNNQWQCYWVEKFRRRGFTASDWLRQEIWNEDHIESFYRQNVIVFEYKPESPYSIFQDVVHPDFYLYKLKTAQVTGWGI